MLIEFNSIIICKNEIFSIFTRNNENQPDFNLIYIILTIIPSPIYFQFSPIFLFFFFFNIYVINYLIIHFTKLPLSYRVILQFITQCLKAIYNW